MKPLIKLIALFAFVATLSSHAAATNDGVALAIVVDNSGSMSHPVRSSQGKSEPKHVIAARALGQVVERLAQFQDPPHVARLRLETALIVFEQDKAKNALPLGAFHPKVYREWLKRPAPPREATPLGAAVALASRQVLESPLPRKHVIVITDGENTQGAPPEATLPPQLRRAQQKNTSLFIHFIAFDIDSNVFAKVKALGATVVGAADEKELNGQLEFILEEKILLEAEPQKPTSK